MKTAAEDPHYTNAAHEPPSTQHSDCKVRILVSELLKGGREATLEHNGMDYRLRITANGKLILTK